MPIKFTGAKVPLVNTPLPAGAKAQKKAHVFEKEADDWYVEDSWVSERLLKYYVPPGVFRIVDPFCGSGQIVNNALAGGYDAFGYDIVDRIQFCDVKPRFQVLDWHASAEMIEAQDDIVIITNPPYKHVNEILTEWVAKSKHDFMLFMPMQYLSGKRKLLKDSRLVVVLVCSPRPNCLPGGTVFGANPMGAGRNRPPEDPKQATR
jgi:hypothetical protein